MLSLGGGMPTGVMLGHCLGRGRKWAALAALILGTVAFAASPTWGSERLKEFALIGTVECGVPSGGRCDVVDTIGVLTDDVTGILARIVVDISWIREDLGGPRQDDPIC